MTSRNTGRRWNSTLTVALVLAAGVHLAGFALFAVRAPLPPEKTEPPATIELLPAKGAEGDAALREYMALTDQRRLLRASPRVEGLVEAMNETARRVPGDAFDLFQPEMTYSTTSLAPLVTLPHVAPDSPLAALRTGDRTQFSEFGRSDRTVVERPAVAGFLTVRSLQDGRVIWRQVMELPAEAPLLRQDWAPAEFTIAVAPAGVVGSPVLAKSSTQEDVDRFLRAYLGRDAHLGERLAPGFYRVGVSP